MWRLRPKPHHAPRLWGLGRSKRSLVTLAGAYVLFRDSHSSQSGQWTGQGPQSYMHTTRYLPLHMANTLQIDAPGAEGESEVMNI